MAVTLLPLHIVDISGVQSWVKSQQKLVNTFAKLADKVSGGIPGVPDVKATIIKILKSQADTLIKLAKAAAIALIMKAFREALAKLPWEKFVNQMNKLIKKMNSIIDSINKAINFLKTLLAPIFPLIIVLTIAFIVAKVITIIPSFGGGWGFIVSNTSIGNIAGAILPVVDKILKDLKPIPGAILSTILQLLSIFAFLQLLAAMLSAFLAKQSSMENSALEAAGKSADDWANSSEDTDASKKFKEKKPKVTMDNDQMVDNMIERLSITEQINKINNQLALGVEASNMGDCTLPDGTIIQTTPKDCAEQGGVFGYGSPPDNPPSPPSSPYTDSAGNVWCWEEPPGEWVCCGGTCFEGLSADEAHNLNLVKGGLSDELDRMGGPLSKDDLSNIPSELRDQVSSIFDKLGTNIITSLLYPDPNVTVEEATKNFGTRYGFYQQETTEDK